MRQRTTAIDANISLHASRPYFYPYSLNAFTRYFEPCHHL
jgi:hypothetical protein